MGLTNESSITIGSASRLVTLDGRDYTVGALVMSNFGVSGRLTADGRDGTSAGRSGRSWRPSRTKAPSSCSSPPISPCPSGS